MLGMPPAAWLTQLEARRHSPATATGGGSNSHLAVAAAVATAAVEMAAAAAAAAVGRCRLVAAAPPAQPLLAALSWRL